MNTQEEKKLLKFQEEALTAFKSLTQDLKVYGDRAKTDDKTLNKRKKKILQEIEPLPKVKKFLNKWVGSESTCEKSPSWRKSTLNIIRDYLSGVSTLKEVCSKFEGKTEKQFKAIELHKKQKTLKEKIPPEIRVFLPPTISIDVDKDGFVSGMNDIFSNKTYTLAEKIKTQKELLKKYNSIVKKVQEDMESEDEFKKLSAIITSIIMETGIRPGKKGNKTIKEVDGKKIEVETFGAVTLKRSHLKFLKNGFVELRFEGKKGSINTALLEDKHLIKVLKDYIENGLIKGSDYLFVSSDGKQYSYQDLTRYFKKNFNGFKITDFRKLKATQEVFDGLNEERKSMLKQIKQIAKTETDDLAQRTTEIIAQCINKAHERAQVALNHESGKTTEKAYINPEVLLNFLNGGTQRKTLEDCILSGKTKLHFDPMSFVRESKTASRSLYATGRKLDSFETLVDILENLF